jgi:DNA gyrase/topoisomerase IV subunit A
MSISKIKELERLIEACETRLEWMQEEITEWIATLADFRKQVIKQEQYKRQLLELKKTLWD